MKRFLMLVGVAAVAAAMYVAASPASRQSRGPTAKQFKALKKQVASLSKRIKSVKAEADAAVAIIGNCFLTTSGSSVVDAVLPVNQFGNTSAGFLYGTMTSAAPRTALDIDTASPLADLQQVNPACVSTSALKHGAVHSGSSRLQLWLEGRR